MKVTLPDIYIAARTVWGESRGEPFQGQLAVAHTLLNRAESSRRDHTLAAAALRAWQFSAWNPGNPNREKMRDADVDDPQFREALRAVLMALDGDDPTGGATHYHAAYAKPDWAVGHTPAAKIGSHHFYTNIGDG